MARLSDPTGFTQIFPYINEFIASLHVADDPAKVGFYSGLVSIGAKESTSSIAVMLAVFHWGSFLISGCRPVILACTLGMTMVSSLFGLSRSLAQILALRAITESAKSRAVRGQQRRVSNHPRGTHRLYKSSHCISNILRHLPPGATVGPLIGGFFSNLATKYPKYFRFTGALHDILFPGGDPPEHAHKSAPQDGAAIAPSDARTTDILELLAIPNVRAISASSTVLTFLDVGFLLGICAFGEQPSAWWVSLGVVATVAMGLHKGP
ncbi:hypothetical protein FB451DRAFT_1179784 [Mycena latifolia]|nr:hypothetical protein FB451DRAFT_1179784 [Mycena latifolia]